MKNHTFFGNNSADSPAPEFTNVTDNQAGKNCVKIENLSSRIASYSEKLNNTITNSIKMHKGGIPNSFHVEQLKTITLAISASIEELEGCIE